MKRYFRIVILMLLFAVPVYSADVVVGIRDNMAASYPPYIIIDEKGNYSGIAYDVVKKVIENSGDRMVPRKMPNIRIIKGISSKEIDIDPFSNEMWREKYSDISIYSLPYAVTQNNFIFRKGEKRNIKNIEDLRGMKVGTVKGYGYSFWEDAFSKGIAKKTDSKDDAMIFEMLDMKRVDLIMANYELAEYMIKKKKYDFEIGNRLHEKPIEIKFRYNIKDKKMQQKYDIELKKMLNNGEIEEIFKKYGVVHK